jgi:lipoprotein-anchoring transpeptidase ErfK/SrfK
MKLRVLPVGLALGFVSAALFAKGDAPFEGAAHLRGGPERSAPLRGGAQDDAAGPWTDGSLVPDGSKSVHILKADEPILIEPRAGAERRGSAGLGEHLPLFSMKQAGGCKSAWLGVGPHAWVCGDGVELSKADAIPATAHTLQGGSDGLPYRYYFVGPDGSLGYRKLIEADIGQPDFEFESGFAVAIVEERNAGGQRYGRTGNDFWIPMRDLGPAHSISFQGAEVPDGLSSVPFGWVVVKSTTVFSGPTSAKPTSESIAEFVKVDVFEEQGMFEKFTRVGDGKWVRSADLRHPVVAAPPDEVDVASHERWIDVDLSTQTVIAMEGERPTYATLVSSGKGRQGAYNATPIGTYRIWVKLTSTNMDNLEDENANRYYRMETVPWVQYFSKGVGLHGAFWHRSFGHQRSHGCVNLAPLDAQRLFWWTGPHVPAGWTAVFPTGGDKGSVVRVR